jgi:hypothetical protein
VNNKAAVEAKVDKEAKRKAGLKKIASLEKQLYEEDSNNVMPKVQSTARSRPL